MNRSTVRLALALVALASGAGATVAAPPRCAVIGGEKLPTASGGSAALCRAVVRAAAARGLKSKFTVQVHVGKRSMLMADVTLAGGARLPTLHHAEMDRAIGRDTFDRFGRAVAQHVATRGR